MWRLKVVAPGLVLFGVAALSVPAKAGNIITFGDVAGACGGAVICSADGTAGYATDGSGEAFNLSTINSWFQINSASPGASQANQLSTQTSAEPDGGTGGFLVVNDTGAAITSFSLTLNDTFNVDTPAVSCGSGVCTDNFAAEGGSQYGFNTELSGVGWSDCTQGSTVGSTCQGDASGVAADVTNNGTSGTITYTWSGSSIAAGATFDISFSSWDNTVFTTPAGDDSGTPIPEPGSIALMGSGLLALGWLRWRRKTRK